MTDNREGIQRRSRNSQRHGILSQKAPLIDADDHDYFQHILKRLYEDYNPQCVIEETLINNLAMCILNQHRLWKVEAALIEYFLLFPSTNHIYTGTRITNKIDKLPTIDLLNRYATAVDRQFHRSINQLREMKNRPIID